MSARIINTVYILIYPVAIKRPRIRMLIAATTMNALRDMVWSVVKNGEIYPKLMLAIYTQSSAKANLCIQSEILISENIVKNRILL